VGTAARVGAEIALGLSAALVRACAATPDVPRGDAGRVGWRTTQRRGSSGGVREEATRAAVRPAPRTHEAGHAGQAAIQQAR
jgi:hypothetical protein